MRARATTLITAALLTLMVLGCATGTGAGGSEAGATGATVQFEIDNNLSGITGVTVYLVRESGTRRTLGAVESGKRAAFSQAVAMGDYTLQARGLQTELQSERIRIDAGTVLVAWDLRANVVRVGTRLP